MAIAIDASSPAVVTGVTSGALTTASFSPPAGSVLVVLTGIGWSGGSPGINITDSQSLSGWFLASSAIGTGNNTVSAVFAVALPTAPGAMTVTNTYTNVGATGGTFMRVLVLTGANATQTATTGHAVVNGTSSTASGQITLSTTQAGSMLYGLSVDGVSNTTFTALGTTTQLGSTFSSAGNFTMGAWQSANPTVTPGSSVYGGTWGAAHIGCVAMFEVLPAASVNTGWFEMFE